MLTRIVELIKSRKKEKVLLEKFNKIEAQFLVNNTCDVATANKEVARDKGGATDFLVEEEILWKSSENHSVGYKYLDKNEARPMFDLSVKEFSLALETFKQSELYANIFLKSSIEVEMKKDSAGDDHLYISWQSDYLKVIERKNINCALGKYVESNTTLYHYKVVHNHRRFNLSERIGVKVSVRTIDKKSEQTQVQNAA